ncbi:MAG: TraR/DksA family transcriptional regulator [Tepidisphaeraceae bacterium]
MAKSTSKKGVSPKSSKATGQSKTKAAPVKAVAKKGALPTTGKAKNRIPFVPARDQLMDEPAVDLPLAAAVPTNGRPRKNLAGITPRELEVFRDAILAKRREIVGDMSSMEREALRSGGGSNLSNLPLHMADMGTDNYEQEFTLGLMEKDRKLLRDLNDGLAKIQNGTYGICEGTGKPIGKARLEAQPWARYSIEYARKIERRLG